MAFHLSSLAADDAAGGTDSAGGIAGVASKGGNPDSVPVTPATLKQRDAFLLRQLGLAADSSGLSVCKVVRHLQQEVSLWKATAQDNHQKWAKLDRHMCNIRDIFFEVVPGLSHERMMNFFMNELELCGYLSVMPADDNSLAAQRPLGMPLPTIPEILSPMLPERTPDEDFMSDDDSEDEHAALVSHQEPEQEKCNDEGEEEEASQNTDYDVNNDDNSDEDHWSDLDALPAKHRRLNSGRWHTVHHA